MRRDYFTLTVGGIETAAEEPTVTVNYEGPTDELEGRLAGVDGAFLAADEIDVAYRLREQDDDETDGVVALTNRVTGEYIFELNAPAERVFEFIDAAHEYGNATDEDKRFRIVVEADGGTLVEYEKATFLVYDEEGDLLRQRSLIPSGVEL